MTQEKLAESLDLAVMTIQFIEQQQRYPSLPKEKILRFLRWIGGEQIKQDSLEFEQLLGLDLTLGTG